MDAQPKALRPYVLITTAFLVIGAGAGVLYWMLAWANGARSSASDVESEDEPHAVDFPARVPAADRDHLRSLGGRLMDPAEGARRFEVEREVVAAGEDVVPVLLSAMSELIATGGTLRDQATEQRFLVLDRLLSKIRVNATPGDPASPPKTPPDPAWIHHRARTWFGWWRERELARGG